MAFSNSAQGSDSRSGQGERRRGGAGVSNHEALHAISGAQTNRLAADPRLARSHIGDRQRQALDHEGAGQTARRVFRRLSRGFYLNSWNDRNNGLAGIFGSVPLSLIMRVRMGGRPIMSNYDHDQDPYDYDDDERFYEETVYNEEYYIEQERELIRQSNFDLELEEREMRKMRAEGLLRPVLIKPLENKSETEEESPLYQPEIEIPF